LSQHMKAYKKWSCEISIFWHVTNPYRYFWKKKGNLVWRKWLRYQMITSKPARRDILPHHQSQLSDLTIRLHVTTSLKSISQIRWLYHQRFKRCFHQFNSLNVNHVTKHSSFSLVNRLQLIYTVKVGHKYINVHRHQLLILSEINNGWSMSFNAKLARNK